MSEPRYRAVRGMQDVLPEEARELAALEALARAVSGCYGYGEIRTPILEDTALFVRSIGEATDIVSKEMFTFRDAGEKSLTLRPEGTAGVVRAYLEKKVYARQPLAKYYYLGEMFRRERPQAGRRRQFTQYGIEALGGENPGLDVETMDLLLWYLRAAGLADAKLSVNSVGCPACRTGYGKELRSYLEAKRDALCRDCLRRLETNVLRVLDCKNPGCRGVVAAAPAVTDFLCCGCREHFARVRYLLNRLGLPFEVNPLLVRGLDYYSRTVFEVYSPSLGAQDAVAAGGRYDGLIEELGGPARGAVGFSVGLERLVLARGDKPVSPPPETGKSIYCVSLNDDAFAFNLALLSVLRKEGVRGEIDYVGRSLKAQLREANRWKADLVLIRGDEEIEEQAVRVKEMETGAETLVSDAKIVDYIRRKTVNGILETNTHLRRPAAGR